MALTGRFGDTTGRPYIEAHLVLPRLGVQANLSFLLDTGADRTVLMPGDAFRLGLGAEELAASPSIAIDGIGGRTQTYIELAVVSFADGKSLYTYDIELIVQLGQARQPDSRTIRGLDIPSLLGRDILDNWRIVYDPPRGKLTTRVDSASIVDLLHGRDESGTPAVLRE